MIRKLSFRSNKSKIKDSSSCLMDELHDKISRRESCPPPVIKDAFDPENIEPKSSSARQSLVLSDYDIGLVPSAHKNGFYFEDVSPGAKIDSFRIGQMGFIYKNNCCIMTFNNFGEAVDAKTQKLKVKIIRACQVKSYHLRDHKVFSMNLPGYLVREIKTNKTYYILPRMLKRMFFV